MAQLICFRCYCELCTSISYKRFFWGLKFVWDIDVNIYLGPMDELSVVDYVQNFIANIWIILSHLCAIVVLCKYVFICRNISESSLWTVQYIKKCSIWIVLNAIPQRMMSNYGACWFWLCRKQCFNLFNQTASAKRFGATFGYLQKKTVIWHMINSFCSLN